MSIVNNLKTVSMIFLNSYLKQILSILLLSFTTIAYGQPGWIKHYKAPDSISYLYDAIPTQSGGYFLGGYIIQTDPTFSLFPDSYPLIIRTDSDGDVIWEKRYFSLPNQTVLEMKELPNGGAIFLTNTFGNAQVVATTSTGDIDWTQTYSGNPVSTWLNYGQRLQRTDDGNFLIIDNYGSVFKITPTGSILWTTETLPLFGMPFKVSAYGNNVVDIGNNSFVAIGGENFSSSSVADTLNMTAKIINSTGVVQRTVLDSTDMKGVAIIRTNDQSLLFVGNTDYAINDSLTLIKTDDNLNLIWKKKHLLPLTSTWITTSIEVWDIKEANNGEIWCLVGEQNQGPASFCIYIFDASGNYLRLLPISTYDTSFFDYYSFGEGLGLTLGIGNPRPSLVNSGGGQIALGLQVYFINNTDAQGYDGIALIELDSSGVTRSTLEGNIYADYNADCIQNLGDRPFGRAIIEATRISDGQTYYGVSDSGGYYNISIDTGTFNVITTVPHPVYWQNCSSSQQVTFNGQSRDTLSFGIQQLANCPLLQVDLSAPFLRATGGGSAYTVSVCNSGTANSSNTLVEVDFDPLLTITGASIPITSQVGNLYTFNMGLLAVGDCNNFTVQVVVDSLVQNNQTLCSEAHVYPDSICLPNYWTGAIIETDGECLNDTVFFEITNTGSNMISPLNYYVFEDHVMMRQGTFQLNNGVKEPVKQPALPGRTYRLSAEQPTGFPSVLGGHLATSVIEGCVLNGNGTFNTGFVNQFSNGYKDPFRAIDCQQAIGAYDPNDKSAQPVGYQSQHYIDTNTTIDYKIRFQNTGNDTAFYVMIKDTLSPYLDPSSLEMGASSHPYTWKLLGNGVLKVSFKDIKLVDSITNEPLSHGFFRYKISQKLNNPIGAVINNRAAIYFDYNAPIITNTTFHTIGENFITIVLSTEAVYEKDFTVRLYPNPFNDFTTLEVEGSNYESLTLYVYDLSGRVVQTLQSNKTSSIQIHRKNLAQGAYIYNLEGDGVRISTGKIIVQGN